MRIAIAADDPAVLNLVAAWLRHLGHVPVRTSDGAELVKLCHVEPPDLALSDLNMPGLGGLDAAERICTETPVPVILMAGHWRDDERGRAARIGVMCVAKPINPLELVLAIASAVR